jgi:maltodextrin utilization protein YvdJ
VGEMIILEKFLNLDLPEWFNENSALITIFTSLLLSVIFCLTSLIRAMHHKVHIGIINYLCFIAEIFLIVGMILVTDSLSDSAMIYLSIGFALSKLVYIVAYPIYHKLKRHKNNY